MPPPAFSIGLADLLPHAARIYGSIIEKEEIVFAKRFEIHEQGAMLASILRVEQASRTTSPDGSLAEAATPPYTFQPYD